MGGAAAFVVGGCLTLLAGAGRCQIAPPPTQSVTVQEVVVTGSHIPITRAAGGAVEVLARQAISSEGDVRLEQAITRLPQVLPGQSLQDNGDATGIATVSLRGLGDERTLVLVDGKRLMPGDPTTGSNAPDINFVPGALVDHIEILTGGASAVYGSDAVAGVVNIILDKRLTGVRLDAEAAFYNHQNDQDGLRAILRAAGVSLPPATVNDGLTRDLNLALGVQSHDGRAHLEVYGGYRLSDPVVQSRRDFSACSLQHAGPTLACRGSTASVALGRFQVFDPNFNFIGDLTLDPNGPPGSLRDFNGPRDGFNFAPFTYLQRPDQRWTAGGFATFQASPNIELYAQGVFMDDVSTAKLAPSGLFGVSDPVGDPFFIACSNPLLSPAEVQAFCGAAGTSADGRAIVFIGRRDVEAGSRLTRFEHRDWRFLTGVRGEAGPWTFDLSAQHGAVDYRESFINDISFAKVSEALDVVRDASGALVCASGAPGCVPFDIFHVGGVTPAAVAFLSTPAHATGATAETVFSGTISGDLGRYGLRSPLASDGTAVALGAEYRRESLSFSPDAEFASGDLASTGAAKSPVDGATEVAEVYGEIRAPLIQNRGWLDDVTLNAGYRFSHYSQAGSSSTYKFGADWRLGSGLRLRAGYNHAVRAPSVVELFTPRVLTIDLVNDPCAGPDPAAADPLATAANCARTGVNAAEYGQIVPSQNNYNGLINGNPELRPETANTITAGVDVAPPFLAGFRASLDWYRIEISGAIAQIGADIIMAQCLATGDPNFCQLIHRAPGTGSLWLSPDGYVLDINQNTALLRTDGVDISAAWTGDLPEVHGHASGSLSASLVGTWTRSFASSPAPGVAEINCVGLYGPICGSPTPRWRHVLRLGWKTPWNVELDGAWRFIGPSHLDLIYSQQFLSGPIAANLTELGARSYFDLSLAWRASSHLTLRAGVNNLFDSNPPLTPFGANLGNGDTFSSFYDSLGRFLFASVSARL